MAKDSRPEASYLDSLNASFRKSLEGIAPEAAAKCAHCGSNIPEGNLFCYMCGNTVPMEEADQAGRSQQGYRTSLDASAPPLDAARYFPQADSSSVPGAPGPANSYYPPPMRMAIPVEEYGKKERTVNFRHVLAWSLLVVILGSIGLIAWKYRTGLRDFANLAKRSLSASLEKSDHPAKKAVTAAAPVHAKTRVPRIRARAAEVALPQPPPVNAADFMPFTVDAGPARVSAIPSSFTALAQRDHVGVTISRAALTVTPEMAPSPLRIEISPRESLNMVLRQVAPTYPAAARAARVQGAVVLKIVIGADGLVKDLYSVSGNPLLAPAAIAAVKQWMYRPYYRYGEPQQVETLVVIEFSLADSRAVTADER